MKQNIFTKKINMETYRIHYFRTQKCMAISINKPCCMLRTIDLDSMLRLRTVSSKRHHFLCIYKLMQRQDRAHTVHLHRFILHKVQLGSNNKTKDIIINKLFASNSFECSSRWEKYFLLIKKEKEKTKPNAIEKWDQRKLKEEKAHNKSNYR